MELYSEFCGGIHCACVVLLTVCFGRGGRDSRGGCAVVPVVGRDGAACPAVAPLALAADVRAAGVDERGAPGLVLGEVGLVPRALAVHDAVELEREDARLPLRGARHRHAYPLCKRKVNRGRAKMCMLIDIA